MNSLKLGALSVAAALMVAGAQAMPALANGSTAYATMHLGTGLLEPGSSSNGKPVPDGFAGTVPVAANKSESLTAPKFLYDATTQAVYAFAFWDVDATPAAAGPLTGKLVTTAHGSFTTPAAGTDFDATAWYTPYGGGCGRVLPDGQCATEAVVAAFSLANDKPLTPNPIGSVAPASDWTAPADSVSTVGVSPTITAQTCLAGSWEKPTKFSSGGCSTGNTFSTWFAIGSTTTPSGASVTVPAGGSPYLIAMYDYDPIFSTACIPGPPPNCT